MIDKKQVGNIVWDILVNYAGAKEYDREEFLRYFHIEKHGEFRFCGKLGFGGKLYFSPNTYPKVNCYMEDLTQERTEIIYKTNRIIKEKINQCLLN